VVVVEDITAGPVVPVVDEVPLTMTTAPADVPAARRNRKLSTPGSHTGFKGAILFSGYVQSTHQGIVERINMAAPLNTPALVWAGETDVIISPELSREASSKFATDKVRFVVSSTGGHAVPTGGDGTFDQIVSYVRETVAGDDAALVGPADDLPLVENSIEFSDATIELSDERKDEFEKTEKTYEDRQFVGAVGYETAARHTDENGQTYYYSNREDETADRRTYYPEDDSDNGDTYYAGGETYEYGEDHDEEELYYTSTGSARFVHVCGRGEDNEDCNARCDCLGGRFHVAQPMAAVMAVLSLLTVAIAIAVSCCVGRYMQGARQMQKEHEEELQKYRDGGNNGNATGATRRRYDDTVNVLNVDPTPAPRINRSGGRRNVVAPRSPSPSPAPNHHVNTNSGVYVVDGTPAAQAEQEKMQALAAAYNHAYAMQLQQQERERDAMTRRQAQQAGQGQPGAAYTQQNVNGVTVNGMFVPHSQAQAEYPQNAYPTAQPTVVTMGEPVQGHGSTYPTSQPQQYH